MTSGDTTLLPLFLILFTVVQSVYEILDHRNCQVSVELLHWIVENIVQAWKKDLS